jgi:hypothetical protein
MNKVKASVTLRDDPLGYIEDYLLLLNGLLKLTGTEIKVLAAFLDIDDSVCATKQGRKIVAERLKMKNVAVLNNYVKSLKDKGCIYKDRTGLYRYNDIVSPRQDIESIEFVLKPHDRSNVQLSE